MATPKVKICGITRAGDAALALELGADLLGFNFYEGSARYIEAGGAREIIESAGGGSCAVGLFVNSPAERVQRLAAESGVHLLQFHGDEDENYLQKFRRRPVIKAVRMTPDIKADRLLALSRSAEFLLFDSFQPHLFGGTGTAIADELLAFLKAHGLLNRAFLSGGISSENAAEKIERYEPYGLDVASGVESAPGVKDPAKLRALMDAVKRAGRTE